MPIIKKPAMPPEIVTLEIEIEQPLVDLLDRYAEFIGSDRNHVAVSAVRLIFKRDYEFKRWLRAKSTARKPEKEGETKIDSGSKAGKS